jgi:plastocyanin
MRASIFASALLIVLCNACGDDGTGLDNDVEVIEMRDGNTFFPATVTIDRGTTVRWRNVDNINHNSVSTATTAWNSGTIAPNNTSPPQRFDNAGSFPYQCTFHAGMNGTINVN